MTTNPSTNNPGDELPAGLPDPQALARLANEFFAALPGSGVPGLTTSQSPAPAVPGGKLPSEAELRKLPAFLAGSTGQQPATLATPPAVADADAPFYFLRSGQPATAGTAPALRPDRPGLDPTLGTTVPNVASTAGPRVQPHRSGIPGSQHGSTPPATPGVELGSTPVAGAVAPASAYSAPSETELHALPALLAGGVGLSPQTGLSTAAVASSGSPHYFLDIANPNPPRTVPDLDLKPRDADLEFAPDLDIAALLGSGLSVPASRPAAPSVPGGAPVAVDSPVSEVSLYFLEESGSLSGTPATTPLRRDSIPGQTSAHPGFDIHAIRRDFPILQERVHGRQLVWLDNAATTQKPQAVIDRLAYFYQHENSNIHRAAHELAARATDAYEAARDKVAHFLNAPSSQEIVFVRGTTEAINLIAKSWGKRYIGKDDEIVISWLEHHANIVPWQQLCAEVGAKLKVAPVDDHGQILLDEYERLFTSRTKLAAFSQVSNALGTVTPAKAMIEIAHRHGAKVLLDGAQAVSHMRVDVQDLDCDWYVFSGHKVFGPTGIGAVYGKLDLLNATPPWQGGGNMIQDVTFEKTIYQPAPSRFEAGTGNIADAVGLGAALDYVERIGMDNIHRYEHELLVYGTQALLQIPGLKIIGTAPEKAGVLSFVLDGFKSEEVGAALNEEGIAVRSGHHCAQPILRRFGLETTVRPSLAFYNTCEEIDKLVDTVRRLQGGSKALRR